ncbi:MAG TPA: glycosyltransferase family 4 protein [Stellaceae bacterium]|nr:glycosyltransferase family 4 protein [Stellaceae bacterium]
MARLMLRRVAALRLIAGDTDASGHFTPSRGTPPEPRNKGRICILSRKDLRDITRVPRMAKALTEAGYAVTVVALRAPVQQLQDMCPEVEYVSVTPRPITTRLLTRRRRRVLPLSISVFCRRAKTVTRRTVVGMTRARRKSFETAAAAWRACANRARAVSTWSVSRFEVGVPGCRQATKAARRLMAVAPIVIVLKRCGGTLAAAWDRADGTAKILARSIGRLAHASYSAISVFGWLVMMARRVVIVAPFTFVLKKSDESFVAAWRDAAGDSTLTLLKRFVSQLHQWALTHAFAEAADKATHVRRFDVVQAHDNYAIVAAARLAARDRAKLVYDAVELSTHRLALELSRLEALREWCERSEEAAIFRKSDLMLAVGDGVASWYAGNYAVERPLVVRNCRYYWPFQADGRLRADAGLDGAARVVVWSGSAYPQQGIELLLDAVPLLPAHIHIVIVATALPRWTVYLNDELPRRAAALGVSDRVHFLPAQAPNDLVPYTSGADIGAIPRPSEHLNNFLSMPNKFLEMVMSRLPIAVSRLGDMAEMIERHRIGTVFDERDPAAIAAAIEGMLAPQVYPELRANVMKAAEEMTWEREGAAYVAAIGALIPASAGSAPVSGPAPAAASRPHP